MSKGETLRALVTERLTAAAEEIFALVERTIAEYEEELCRSKEENQRRQQLLEEALSTKVHTDTIDAQIQTESQQQVPEEVLNLRVHTQSTDVQIQTESPNKMPSFKQEDEGNQDVTHVIVKCELDDSEDEVGSDFPASDHQMETEALIEVCEERSEAQAPNQMETDVLIEDCSSGPTIPQTTAPLNAAFQTTTPQDLTSQTTAPQNINPMSIVDIFSGDMADKTQEPPVAKRKRGRPRRVLAPTDIEGKSPQQLSQQTIEKLEETKSVKRRVAETKALPTISPKTQMENKGVPTRKKDLDQEPVQSKCPKSKSKYLASLERVGQNTALTSEKGILEFKCSYCDRVFTRLHHLERHVLIHTGERSFICTVCDKNFRLKQHLISHMTIHKEERLFSCPVCPQKFKRKDNLGRHIMVHTGIKPYGCSQCDIRFSLKKNLTRHMIVHNRDVVYSCSFCKMKFSSPFYFQKHTKTHMKRK